MAAAFVMPAVMGCAGDGGSVHFFGQSTFGSSDAGLVDGPVASARFSNPVNVAVASNGTVYVADFDNDAVRAISTSGQVTTLTDQDNFSRPFGMTVAADGTLYVQTDANDLGERSPETGTVWKIDRSTGVATVVARNLGRPRGIAALADGRIALSDLVHNTISILNPSNGNVTPVAGNSGTAGFADGSGTSALFSRPYGLAAMADGSLLVADQSNHRLRRVTLSGDVTTFSGTGTAGATNGPVATATFNAPEGVAIASNGTIYVADHDNHMVRRISGGQVFTQAGNGNAGYAEGNGTEAEFFGLEGLALAPGGRVLWVADGNNGDGGPYNRVRRLTVP